jgi:hypothetical protein
MTWRRHSFDQVSLGLAWLPCSRCGWAGQGRARPGGAGRGWARRGVAMTTDDLIRRFDDLVTAIEQIALELTRVCDTLDRILLALRDR